MHNPSDTDSVSESIRPLFQSTSECYKKALHLTATDPRKKRKADWTIDECSSIEQLHSALEAAEKSPESTTLKEDRRTRVFQSLLFGRQVVIKSYTLTKRGEYLKYLVRISPARRFWAISRTLQQLHIPTPTPLACLECYSGGVPVKSYMVNAYLPNTITAREWIEPRFHQLAPDEKDQIMRMMLEHLLLLYRNGIYHKDTKCENILVGESEETGPQTLSWIDLECCLCKRPARHDIIRNLVQLNGAIGLKVTREDRLAFLQLAAQTYPWLEKQSVIDKICNWTARRLEKEKCETA